MKTRKTSRPGSGRTKGSFSFANATLAQLNAQFPDPNTQVPISRKWAQSKGLNGLVIAPANQITKGSQPVAPVVAQPVTPAAPDTSAPAVVTDLAASTPVAGTQ